MQKTEVDFFKSHLLLFMQIHDFRFQILQDSDDQLIQNNFPLKLGGGELEVGVSYHINCKY